MRWLIDKLLKELNCPIGNQSEFVDIDNHYNYTVVSKLILLTTFIELIILFKELR